MALDSHVAILTHSALAQAVVNKKNGRTEFYALIAFPPAAGNDLADVLKTRANGAPLSSFSIRVQTNAQQKKPIPGVPADWFVIRAASQFAPYLADAQGSHLDQANPTNALAIRQTFFAGAKVRVAFSAFAWTYDRNPGLSFNLDGLMIVNEAADRLNIGNTAANVFAKHAQTGAAPADRASPFNQQTVQTTAAQESGGAQGSNPFAQTAKPDGSNPFV